MHDLEKIKRQIEIVGLCAGSRDLLRPVDLADLYGCEELTIKRDLRDLRGSGVDIHSTRSHGVGFSTPLPAPLLRTLLSRYLGICTVTEAVDKATALLVRARRYEALRMAVLLQRGIERRVEALADYEKESGVLERDCVLRPLLLFESDGSWRVLSHSENRIKQYHLAKLRRIRLTERRFTPVPRRHIEEMFRHSFRSWIGTEEHTVRLKLDPVWAARIRPRQLLESQVTFEEPDGSVQLELVVNSLDEIASWIVSRGAGVTVLEPDALRAKVIALAQGALANYFPPATAEQDDAATR
jgi:predicted DNA-binding transcriptional regulator YafY